MSRRATPIPGLPESGHGDMSSIGRSRELLLLFAAAAWGLAVALSLAVRFVRPAPPGQPVGFLSAQGLDASAAFQFLPILVALPLVGAVVGRWLFTRVFAGEIRDGAIVFAAVSLISGLWLAGLQGPTTAVILLPLVGVGLATSIRTRSVGWSVEDLILLPVSLAVLFSLLDLMPRYGGVHLLLALIAVLTLRIALGFLLPTPGLASRAFALAPLALVAQSSYADPAVRSAGWPGLLIALGTPPILALAIRARPRISPIARGLIIGMVFPLVVFAYPSTRGIGYAENLPRVHMFENGHSLMPASEMLRGELPWKDVVPGHGLVTDGLLDLAAMKLGDDSVGRVLHWRWRFASLNSIVLYLLVLAATRSPEAGLGAFFLGYSLWGGPFGRSVISLLAVAAAVAATVRSRPRFFLASGFLLVLGGLHSVEFCVYAGVAVCVALLLYGEGWKQRARALQMTVIGIALAAVPMVVTMLSLGIFGDFLRTTFVEVLSLGPVYSLGFQDLSAVVPRPWTFPDVLVPLLRRSAFPYLAWLASLLVVAVLAVLTKRSPATSALIVIGSWMTIASLSWFERHHLYFMFAMSAFLVTLVVLLWRSGQTRGRVAAAWLLALLIAVAQPTSHLTVTAAVRLMPPVPEEGWSEYGAVRRARGALFRDGDIANLEIVREFIDQHLAEGETFFDFADAPILYYLFNRPSPIRQYEVAFFQTEALQREVIERLESDSTVRFALLRFPTEIGHDIDGVPNELRAPLVAQYLQDRFEMVLDTGEVRIAIRSD